MKKGEKGKAKWPCGCEADYEVMEKAFDGEKFLVRQRTSERRQGERCAGGRHDNAGMSVIPNS